MYYYISHKRKTIVTHIAKNGCESLRYLLLKDENIFKEEMDIWNKMTQNIIHNPHHVRYFITQKNYKLITIVRDPYRRLVSGYVDKILGNNYNYLQFCKNIMQFYRRDFNDKRRVTFEEFVNYVVAHKNYHAMDEHFKPQSYCYHLNMPKNTIMKLEDIKPIKEFFDEQGFTQNFINYNKEIISRHYKTQIDNNEKVHNKTADYFNKFDKTIPKYEYFLTEELKEKIYNFYKKDFVLYKYNKN